MYKPLLPLGLFACATVLAVGLASFVLGQTPASSQEQQGAMHGCPLAGKWSVAVWDGDTAAEAGQALATCSEVSVVAAYHLDAEAQIWSRWLSERPELTTLATLDPFQGVLALGGAEAPATPTPTPSVSATPTTTPTPTASPTPTPSPTLTTTPTSTATLASTPTPTSTASAPIYLEGRLQDNGECGCTTLAAGSERYLLLGDLGGFTCGSRVGVTGHLGSDDPSTCMGGRDFFVESIVGLPPW